MFNLLSGFDPLNFIMSAAAVVIALTFHEIAHGLIAYKLGDTRAKRDGRLSLNPLRHMDWIGFICILLFHFGWAKPVVVEPGAFKYPKQDMALTALAGPAANLLQAFVGLLLYALFYILVGSSGAMYYLLLFLQTFAGVNLSLAVFNLLPIPPLDGSKVYSVFLPDRLYFRFIDAGRIGMVIMLILIVTNGVSYVLTPLIQLLYNGMFFLVGKILFFL